MKINPRTVKDKNGKEFRLVSIGPEYAKQYVEFMHDVSQETHYMARYADEISLNENDIEVEGIQLKWLNEDTRQSMFSIIDNERIVGNIAIRTVGKGRKSAHRCSIGLGVRKEYKPACNLYRKMGFVEWGRFPDAFRLDDGESIDEITMYKAL